MTETHVRPNARNAVGEPARRTGRMVTGHTPSGTWAYAPTRESVGSPLHGQCGHVGRSTSPVVKQAAIMAQCVREVPGFTLDDVPMGVVRAMADLILSGAPCALLHAASDLASWHADATDWAGARGESYLILPATPDASQTYGGTGTGLSYLLPYIVANRTRAGLPL